MNKKNLAPILAGLSIAMGAGVFVAYAQSYVPLAPLPGTYTGSAGSETTDLSTYLSGIIKLLIALGAMMSIFVTILGGVQYVASGITPSAKQDAKNRITNALIGLTLILTSYLILNSINPELVNLKFELPPVSVALPTDTGTAGGGTSECVTGTQMGATGGLSSRTAQGWTCVTAQQGSPCYGKDENGQGDYQCTKPGPSWPDDAEVREQLTSQGILVQGSNTNDPCSFVGQGKPIAEGGAGGDSCTSVYRLPMKAINGVITLKEKSGAPVVVTGGTEYWLHQTHGSASSFAAVVDIRKYSSLDTYITTKGTCTPEGIGCGVRSAQHCKLALATATGSSAGEYVDEVTHWHVCY